MWLIRPSGVEMNKTKIGDNMKTILMVQLIVVLIIGTGWVKNLIKLSDCDFEAPYKAEIIHTAGLLPPVGMVTGWMSFDDGKVKQ